MPTNLSFMSRINFNKFHIYEQNKFVKQFYNLEARSRLTFLSFCNNLYIAQYKLGVGGGGGGGGGSSFNEVDQIFTLVALELTHMVLK